MEIPDDTLTIILAKLPLKSITRFRSLNKAWKSRLDSDFFRDQYKSLNNSSSVSWSIVNTEGRKLSLEIVGHHGCDTWGLNRSLGDLMRFNTAGTTIRRILLLACTDGLVSIYTEASDGTPRYYIGNPLLEQWTQIDIPDSVKAFMDLRVHRRRFSKAGLVTKMENGVVVSYKVVWMVTLTDFTATLQLFIYSSERGRWNSKTVRSHRPMVWSRLGNPIPLNGVLHWLSSDDQIFDVNSIIAYDVYKDDESLDPNAIDDSIVLCFPDVEHDYHRRRRYRRTFRTSEGSLVYFNEYIVEGGRTLRVWKLVKYSTDDPTVWHLSWQINLVPLMIEFGVDYFPVVMHPLNFEEIYLWSRNINGMIIFNLRTYRFSVHKESSENGGKCMDGCIMSFKCCKEYMDRVYRSFLTSSQGNPHDVYFSQYVLPKSISSLPQPQPQL